MALGWVLTLAMVLSSVQAIQYYEVIRRAERFYSTASEICCNGTIYENKNSSDYECCGGHLIETAKEICCFPTAHQREPSSACCGNKVFNSETHFCHDQFTTFRTKDTSWTVEKNVILPLGADLKSTCGDKVIDLDVAFCCNALIVPNPDQNLRCCGSAYDPAIELCCGTAPIPKTDPSDNRCCGELSYNSEINSCRGGQLVDYIPYDETRGRYCGGIVMSNSTDEICCSNNLVQKSEPDHDRCCGDATYNRKEFLCCTDNTEYKLYSNTESEDKKCCGAELTGKREWCCNGQSYNPRVKRCCNYYAPFNAKTETCCELWTDYGDKRKAKVYEGVGRECCGLEVFDVDTEECCGSKIITKPPDGQSGCCPYSVHDFDTDDQIKSFTSIRYGDGD